MNITQEEKYVINVTQEEKCNQGEKPYVKNITTTIVEGKKTFKS